MFSTGAKLPLTTFLWSYWQIEKSLITCRHHKLVFPFYHDTSNNITLYPSYGKDGPAPCWEKIIEKRFVLVRVWVLKANPLTTQTCTSHVPKIYVDQNDYGGLTVTSKPNAHSKFKSFTTNSKHSQQIQITNSELQIINCNGRPSVKTKHGSHLFGSKRKPLNGANFLG